MTEPSLTHYHDPAAQARIDLARKRIPEKERTRPAKHETIAAWCAGVMRVAPGTDRTTSFMDAVDCAGCWDAISQAEERTDELERSGT